jgi:hypothetical protein
MAEHAEIRYHVSMSSLSSFDDLLSELDGPSATPGQDREDPLRASCLKQLVELSTRLEKVAQILDPSESKHPLFQQTIPAEQRAHLKQLVGELMRVQGELQKIEESLLQEGTPPSSEIPSEKTEHPSLDESLSPTKNQDELPAPRKRIVPEAERAPSTPAIDPIQDIQPKEESLPPQELTPTIPITPQTPTPAPAPKSVASDPSLKKEQEEFAAYKAQWEAAFAQDPALRAAHPEVAEYYEQMENYFQEKERHLKASASLDSTS